jgi:hypothetical protein
MKNLLLHSTKSQSPSAVHSSERAVVRRRAQLALTRHQDGVIHVGFDQGDLVPRFTGSSPASIDETASLAEPGDVVDGDCGSNREPVED